MPSAKSTSTNRARKRLELCRALHDNLDAAEAHLDNPANGKAAAEAMDAARDNVEAILVEFDRAQSFHFPLGVLHGFEDFFARVRGVCAAFADAARGKPKALHAIRAREIESLIDGSPARLRQLSALVRDTLAVSALQTPPSARSQRLSDALDVIDGVLSIVMLSNNPSDEERERLRKMRDLARGAKEPGDIFAARVRDVLQRLHRDLPAAGEASKWSADDRERFWMTSSFLKSALRTSDLPVLWGHSRPEGDELVSEVLAAYEDGSISTPERVLAELIHRALRHEKRLSEPHLAPPIGTFDLRHSPPKIANALRTNARRKPRARAAE